jgi:GTP cyclohydrolase I
MLPFYGKAHIAYIPDEYVIGLSKLARLLDIYAKRLQIQERIGHQVTEALMTYLKPKGAACIIEARHHCMCSRGVGKQNSVAVTSSMKGAFLEKPAARQELLHLIYNK